MSITSDFVDGLNSVGLTRDQADAIRPYFLAAISQTREAERHHCIELIRRLRAEQASGDYSARMALSDALKALGVE